MFGQLFLSAVIPLTQLCLAANLGLTVIMISEESIEESINRTRSELIDAELKMMVGGSLILTSEEERFNQHLMQRKYEEVDRAFKDENKCNPSKLFTERKAEIEKSKVFQLIRKMPKGAALHVHDTALLGHDYVIKNITYKDNLYMCQNYDSVQFKFSDHAPIEDNCIWNLVRDLREKSLNAKKFDEDLARHISLEFMDPTERSNNYDMWKRFIKIFGVITPLLTYRPVWEEYFYEALKKYRDDGVFYLEVRTTLPRLYELDGTLLDEIETAKSYKRVNDRFVKNYPDVLGSRMIYAPSRGVTPEDVEKYINTTMRLKYEVGDYLAGFDLVGQEDAGEPLQMFLKQLYELKNTNVNVFYHAGETNWYGTETDFNLYDALLLGAKRIGHGYALVKHPVIAGILKDKDIAIEVNPISNQVLMLVDDLRNHPASIMLANNMPMVISSDDPGLWGALPLSHDMYELFVGLASRHADLKMLKQLALNSIKYSTMTDDEKARANDIFETIWSDFLHTAV